MIKVIQKPVTDSELQALAKIHDGIVKVVVDIKRNKMAAGGQWHSDCLKLLEEKGSNAEDCWGAKYNIDTGEIEYKSQINKNRPHNTNDLIEDEAIQGLLKKAIQEYLEPQSNSRF